jgi:periplasmic divalent cation tolerance protein
VRVVLCNCPESVGPSLARTLVEEELAACVNILPGITSIYRWQGKIVEDTEMTLLIKVAQSRVNRLGDRIRELHPYETVEILSLPVQLDESDSDYVRWVRGKGQA